MSNFFSKIKNSKGIIGKVKEILLLGVLAVALIYSAWIVFHTEEDKAAASYGAMTESEMKVMRILQEIEGVGKASVAVHESDTEVKSVVVVCEGANNLRVVMDVREAVAAALGAEQKSVKVYLKKD